MPADYAAMALPTSRCSGARGVWFVRGSSRCNGAARGRAGRPDRDGDGRVELGVYRRGIHWFFKDATTGSVAGVRFATRDGRDVPIGRSIAQPPWREGDRDFDYDGREM